MPVTLLKRLQRRCFSCEIRELFKNNILLNRTPVKAASRGFEILDWCPARPVLPHGEKVPLYLWLATLLVMLSRKNVFWVDVLHRPASHPIFSYWVG